MKYLITMILLALASGVLAQPVEEWVARYNGPADGGDGAYALAVDAEGNVYVTGGSEDIGSDADYLTIKYDANGNELWAARYNGLGIRWDRAQALALDNERNVYVTGYSYGSGTDLDMVTLRYDEQGNELWVARYNGPGNGADRAYDLVIGASGNVYVTGYSTGSGSYDDYTTIKYDADGNELWTARYDGPANDDDWAFDMAIDTSGNIYVTGFSTASGSFGDHTDCATIKYDASGDTLWVRRYDGGDLDDRAVALALDACSNVYVTGSSGEDYVTIKYDTNGNPLWLRRYEGPTGSSDNCATAITVDASGNAYVTGYSCDSINYSEDYATIKYDPNGNELWVARYNGPGNSWDFAYALAVDNAGNVYVTGVSWHWDYGGDYLTVKYNSNGNQLCMARYDGPGNDNDEAFALAVDASGNVYVTGWSTGSGTGFDYATIKYSQPTGVEEQLADNIMPGGFRLTCKPNPFNASTTIMYSLSEAGEVCLSIYNLGGQLIETLVEDYNKAGEYEILWDAADYCSGIYFYKLTAGDYTETRSMTLLK